MSAIFLARRDPAKNMHRYYVLGIQSDLFGSSCLVREWGRIGGGGQLRSSPYPTFDAAQAALDRQRRAKERRDTCGRTRNVFRSVQDYLDGNQKLRQATVSCR